MSLSMAKYNGEEYLWSECPNAQTDNLSSASFTIENLNFGTLDNISALKKSNVIYLRLKLSKSIGNHIAFSLNTPENTNPFNIYYFPDGQDSKPTMITNETNIKGLSGKEILSNLSTVYAQSNGYFEYSYAFSDVLAPNLDELEFGDTQYFNTEILNEDIVFTGDQKYLFLKLVPKLDSYLQILETITPFMPCHMEFTVDAEFEVTENGGTVS